MVQYTGIQKYFSVVKDILVLTRRVEVTLCKKLCYVNSTTRGLKLSVIIIFHDLMNLTPQRHPRSKVDMLLYGRSEVTRNF